MIQTKSQDRLPFGRIACIGKVSFKQDRPTTRKVSIVSGVVSSPSWKHSAVRFVMMLDIQCGCGVVYASAI